MTIEDANKHLHPPYGYQPTNLVAEGAYLRATYLEDACEKGQTILTIYLNDMGREVARSTTYSEHEKVLMNKPEPVPVGRWYRFQNGFLILIEGLREMLCLNK